MNEAQVRELVAEAVSLARRTTQGNVCDDACVQWTMKDKFVDGRWRSSHFMHPEPGTSAEARLLDRINLTVHFDE
jgi:hypothetical protein